MAERGLDTTSREELFELAWTTPMTRLAAQFGLSDQGLRKHCIQQQIPLPKAGHWAKAAVGRAPNRPKLPAFSARKAERHRLEKRRARRTAAAAEDAGWIPPVVTHAVDERGWHLAMRELRRDVLEDAKSHVRYREAAQWEADHPGRRHRSGDGGRWAWFCDSGQLLADRHKAMALRTSLPHHERALRLCNTVLNRARDAGFSVELDQQIGRFVLSKSDAQVHLRLSEKLTQGSRMESNRWSGKLDRLRTLTPTGRFRIYISHRYGAEIEITDKPGEPLEQRMADVAESLERIVDADLKAQARRREEQARWAEEEKQRIATQRLKELEQAQLEQEVQRSNALVAEAQRWKQANDLRDYLDALDLHATTNPNTGDEYAAWRFWAQGVLDSLDPLPRRFRSPLQMPVIEHERAAWESRRSASTGTTTESGGIRYFKQWFTTNP